MSVHGNISLNESDSSLVMNPNASEKLVQLTYPPKFNVSGELNETTTTVTGTMWDASDFTTMPLPTCARCFMDTCHKTSTSLYMSTVNKMAQTCSTKAPYTFDENTDNSTSTQVIKFPPRLISSSAHTFTPRPATTPTPTPGFMKWLFG